jgi:hypothetical protein
MSFLMCLIYYRIYVHGLLTLRVNMTWDFSMSRLTLLILINMNNKKKKDETVCVRRQWIINFILFSISLPCVRLSSRARIYTYIYKEKRNNWWRYERTAIVQNINTADIYCYTDVYTDGRWEKKKKKTRRKKQKETRGNRRMVDSCLK